MRSDRRFTICGHIGAMRWVHYLAFLVLYSFAGFYADASEMTTTCSEDISCFVLAEGIYFEARGEGREGMVAMAWVARNRVESPYFADTYLAVLNGDDCQFSYWCDGKPEYIANLDAWQKCLEIAEGVYTGRIPDPTFGANHFYNPKIARKRKWME